MRWAGRFRKPSSRSRRPRPSNCNRPAHQRPRHGRGSPVARTGWVTEVRPQSEPIKVRTMMHVPPDLLDRLKRHGQTHVLHGWDSLSSGERSALVGQLAGIDLAGLEALFKRKDDPHTVLPPPDRIAPLPVEPRDAIPPAAVAAGEDALRRGEVAVLLVAGGQGSRLGSDKPKGMYPVGPVTGASLFQVHARKV